MPDNRAVVVSPDVAGRLALAAVEPPSPARDEAVVRVAAFSLNLGEIRRSRTAEAGWRPGWDLAGTVERAAADGSGPKQGARVVGLLASGAWTEQAAVPSIALAELPENVSFAQAATLPVAGLTALYALEEGGLLLGRSVLVTGASGGVGHLACQLARAAGARVIGAVHRPGRAPFVLEAGAHEVVVGSDLAEAEQYGPYALVLESVGGVSLAAALTLLAPGGVCVLYGTSAGAEVTLDARTFYATGGTRLYGFFLFHELQSRPATAGLARLAGLVADGRLRPQIDVEAPWTQVGAIAQRLWDRDITGKAVLHVEA